MRGAVRQLLDSYPAATLQDVYKTMFQDRFGVAHLLSDRAKVKAYIEQETLECSEARESYFEPCGWRGDHIRVDLHAIRDGKITSDELTDAFMQSAESSITADSTALAEWQREWQMIITQNYDRLRKLEGFEQDSTMLAEMISSGNYVVHHSQAYNSTYHPHYRIVSRREAERLNLK